MKIQITEVKQQTFFLIVTLELPRLKMFKKNQKCSRFFEEVYRPLEVVYT